MMMNNPGVMVQQGPPPPNPAPPPPQAQQPTTTAQMMPGGVNPTMNLQQRQSANDDILSRCLGHTQRLRESLQVLLNTTKQAANIENDEQSSSSSSTTTATNLSSNSTLRNNIDRRLYDMSTSLDQLVSLIEQYDFKFLQTQQVLMNHYNELSYEKQGTLMDEWSSNAKWADKIIDILPSIHPTTHLYRRSNYRTLNSTNTRSRIDGPSSTLIDRIIAQFDSAQQQQQQQQQQSTTKEYSISVQRLSDHLNILEFSLFRSGLDIYLYLRHCTVEHVIVKPLNEKKQFANNYNNKLLTNYRALDIIAGHIRAAAVYYAPFGSQADQVLGKLLLYISKYQMLHALKCVNCQKHLLNGLQPTWRDFKTYESYHEECLN
jgi:mediator of RNA polymerase II transcription subunit 27